MSDIFSARDEHDGPPDEVVERYLRGVSSIEERDAVVAWTHRNPGGVLALEALRIRLREPWGIGEPVDTGTLASRIHEAIANEDTRTVSPSRLPVSAKPRPTRAVFPVARSWGMGVGLGLTCLALGAVALLGRRTSGTMTEPARIYKTGADQEATIRLADGTRVLLAPNTTMRAMPFDARARTVVFDRGEAYFSVAHASGAPFVVRHGGATAQVLGTEFLVRGAGDASLRVAVASGRVRLQASAHAGSDVTLAGGQTGDVTDSTVRMLPAANGDSVAGLGRGLLVFRKVPASAVLETLSRWYGYQFRYADATLPDRIVTIGISTQSSAKALAAIKRVLSVNMTVVGDTVTLVEQSLSPTHGMPRKQGYDTWTPNREVGR